MPEPSTTRSSFTSSTLSPVKKEEHVLKPSAAYSCAITASLSTPSVTHVVVVVVALTLVVVLEVLVDVAVVIVLVVDVVVEVTDVLVIVVLETVVVDTVVPVIEVVVDVADVVVDDTVVLVLVKLVVVLVPVAVVEETEEVVLDTDVVVDTVVVVVMVETVVVTSQVSNVPPPKYFSNIKFNAATPLVQSSVATLSTAPAHPIVTAESLLECWLNSAEASVRIAATSSHCSCVPPTTNSSSTVKAFLHATFAIRAGEPALEQTEQSDGELQHSSTRDDPKIDSQWSPLGSPHAVSAPSM